MSTDLRLMMSWNDENDVNNNDDDDEMQYLIR